MVGPEGRPHSVILLEDLSDSNKKNLLTVPALESPCTSAERMGAGTAEWEKKAH